MAFSAAELQKRHGLEGAPDPFPTLGGGSAPAPASSSSAKKISSNGTAPPVDTSSEDAFPSLGASAAPATTISKPAVSMWSTKPSTVKASKGPVKPSGAGGLGRTGVPTAGSHPFAETFSLPTSDIETGKTMGEVLKKVTEQTGAIIESSTQMRTGLKTFHIRAADAKRLAYARKMIESGLSKSVTIQVQVPITTLGTIIGPKGATLKAITDSTQCKIDIPKRDTLPAYEPTEAVDSDDENEEPLVSISVTGPSVACNDAKSKILALISHKTSQTSTSIKTIPSSYYPFIAGPKGSKARQLEEEFGDVKVHVPPPAVWKALEKQAQGEEDQAADRDLSIKVRGDKEKVKLVVAEITKRYEELNDSLRELKISIPKRQHRFLVGAAADEILDQTSCIVELPPVEDPSDQCVIRGPQPSLIPALTLVMDKANAIAVEMVDIVALHRPNTSDPLSHAKKVLRYLQRSSKLRSIAEAHEGVKVFPPFASAVASTGSVVIEIVGENKSEVAKAKDDVAGAVKAVVPSAIAIVEVDPLVHPLLIGKKGSKIAQFESANSVTTVFPPAADESSEVLLVFTGAVESLPSDKKAKEAKLKELLGAASAALSDLAKDAADIKSETLDIEKKWHRFIIGQGGTVLNALIGEDHLVNVKVGSGSGSKSGAKTNGAVAGEEDIVVVRGPSGEVDRVVAQIKQIVEDAKNDDIINGYTVEFAVDKKHVPHLVGSAGAAINKLRETLGVKVNFDDEAEGKKGKKGVAHCSIVGRKEAVEEAKKRLEAQIEKLEDETTETVTIKRAIQPALIGSGGKYAIRLEEKYGVKLSFPRDNKDGSASSKPDEVTIRGGKKGVASAKAELLEAAAFETESRQSLTFTVPTKAVAQIVGKSGATINGIKDETGAQIDIDKTHGDDGKTSVTVRGDKKAIAAAKAKVLEVVDQAGDEIQVSVTVDPKYHRTLIGQGGGKLRELIASCGGPSEGFKQAGLVTFPKSGDSQPDQVRLRGDSKIVKALQAELEKQVAVLQSTITIGVVVPHSQHASKIGRGGSALQDLQKKTGTVIHFPGSRQYGSVGDIENKEELGQVDEKDIVKVIGSKEASAQAAELLQVSSERAPRTDARNRDTSDMVSKTLSFPAKYYHAIADQPNLIRQIRSSGGQISLPQPAPPRVKFEKKLDGVDGGATSLAAKAARIDLDAAEQDEELVQGEWELRDNFEGMPAGDLDWVVHARSEEELEKAVKLLESAAEKAKSSTHVGLLTGLPRSAFPRIIGSKGATISRLRVETGADIQVGKDDDLIVITGDEASVLQAKDAIVGIASRQGGQRY
ncbi:putative SCP160 protein [Naematelia encephala]|uniref:Putative SCP160 protein n=1 Tax=Naematelia encephala TaxID=71784 RepID=A0A1Y2BF37_9TREE|nr:putative SCP160 protein [Naematelia encephala]